MASPPLLLPHVAVDEAELRAALQSVAIPGYTGSVQVEIGLRKTEDGKSFVIGLIVLRRQTKRIGACESEKQMLPDPERRKPVERVIDELKPFLFVRPIMPALEVYFDNGKAVKYTPLVPEAPKAS